MGNFKFAENAFYVDADNNVYTGKALYLAMMLHASGTIRTPEAVKEVEAMFDNRPENKKKGRRK